MAGNVFKINANIKYEVPVYRAKKCKGASSIAKIIRFNEYMEVSKLSCTKPNYISNGTESNLTIPGMSPAESDLSNTS